MQAIVAIIVVWFCFAVSIPVEPPCPNNQAVMLGPRTPIVNMRPKPWERKFVSHLVEAVVEAGQSKLNEVGQVELGKLFANCYPNTLDTTVLFSGLQKFSDWRGQAEFWDTFVITGDIPAMWLRDSANQVTPYLTVLRLASELNRSDAAFVAERQLLENFFHGLVHRQVAGVNLDPYAQAFAWWGAEGMPNTGKADTHQTFRKAFGGGSVNGFSDQRIFERNLEIDSLCSVFKLAAEVLNITRDFGRVLADRDFVPALVKAMDVLEDQQHCNSTTYTMQSRSWEPTDTRSHGLGFPCRDTGMVRTPFRPSDDSTIFDFNIPVNAMLATSLAELAPILRELTAAFNANPSAFPWAEFLPTLPKRMARLETEIRAAIAEHGLMQFHGETVFAYEVDGFGNAHFMDDANVPSLLSLPLLGFVDSDDALYRRTRGAILGPNNPWYANGTASAGVGSPHTGPGRIWPMALIVEALTGSGSGHTHRTMELIQDVLASASTNSLVHESFDKDDTAVFSRPWFAWANTLFGQLIVKTLTSDDACEALGCKVPLDLKAVLREWMPLGSDVTV